MKLGFELEEPEIRTIYYVKRKGVDNGKAMYLLSPPGV